MVAPLRNAGFEVPPDAVAELARFYESGLYGQACTLAGKFPSPWEWRGTAACLMGGRIANNVFAPRLARALHARAWRHDKGSAEAAYYFAFSLLSGRGPLAAWKFLRRLPEFPDIAPIQRADLLMLQAHVAGMSRDFSTSSSLIAQAEATGADRAWFWVERGSLHEQQDAYPEALACTQRALEIHPYFRPAVQSAAHQLQLLGRDEEAVTLLQDALQRIESPAVASQLSLLQAELDRHHDARESWQRVRDLSPWMEPKMVDWWEARFSDTCYFTGDLTAAADAAARSKNPFHEKIAERLRAPAPEARRVLLPVGFVRQHYFTCAPATLSALSNYWKMPVDHLALAAAICYDGTPDHIERHWAEENGWHAREFRVTWETLVALIDRGVPFTLTTVETQSAHLQAVIGYDSFRGTLLIRDPYERTHGEWLATEFLERYAASGPRGMLLLPPAEIHRLAGIALPDAELYDGYYRLRRALHTYDRNVAQNHYEEMVRLDGANRLTLQARWALASYDGSLIRQLAAVDELLALYPKNGNYLWSKLSALRELTRRADYQQFLRELAVEKQIDVVFWREWADELRQDARRRNEAQRHLLRSLRFRPLDADNLHSLANLYWDRREFAEATQLYRFAATLRDKVEGYSRSYFLAARHLRQTDTALEMLTRRVEAFGQKSSQPVKLLFWALTALDRQPLAFEKLEAALTVHAEDGDLLLFAADAYARHSQPARGQELLLSAEKRATRTQWLRTAANLADYRCDLTAALTSWREILDAEPLDLPAQRAVSRLLAETQGRAVALEHLRTTCERFDHHIGLHGLWVEWARAENNADAEPVLRRLLTLHPENAWAHRELALVLNELHRPDEAFAELDVAAALEPQSPSTDGVRAHVALQAGRLAEAQDFARAALRLSIDYETAIRDLLAASATFEEKRAAVAFVREELIRQVVFGDGLLAYRTVAFEISEPADLLTSLREALEARPDLWHAWSAVVLQLVDMHQLDEALSLAQQATERFPLLPRLWADLALVHRARRDRESEIAPLQRALQMNPAWSRASQSLANTYERMGNYAEAARILEQAIAASPLDPYNHGTLANVLHHLDRKDEAIQRLEHALKLEPGYDFAWDALRAWSPGTGKENRAAVLARELADLRPGEARSWFVLAKVLIGAPIEERLEALDRALALSPRLIDAHDLRAFLLAGEQRYDEAITACSPAIFGEAIPTSLRGRAAWIDAQRGKTRAAISQMRAVVAAAPEYYWGWNMLAEWSCADHDFPAAQEAARKMARLAPRSAIPLGYLADILARSGEADDALATLQRAYDIDPTYAFAGFNLFDRHLADNKLDEAEKIVALLLTHLPGPASTAAKIRLLTRRRDMEGAFSWLRLLLADPTAEAQTLQNAVNAISIPAWVHEVEEALTNVLHLPETNPEVGALWVLRFAARTDWMCRKRLFQLGHDKPVGRRAYIAYIEQLARHQKTGLLRQLIRQEEPWLRRDADAWGTVAFAYTHLQDSKKVIQWMHDWERRTDLQPWMLLNLATAYRQTWNDHAALLVNQRALRLPPDGTTTRHRLWVVHEIAQLGDMPAVKSRLEELREHELSNYEKALLALIKALRAMFEAAPSARKGVFKSARQDLQQRYEQGAYADPPLNRARRRTLATLSRVSGDPFRWLRPLMPEFGGQPRPTGQPAAARGSGTNISPRNIWIIVILASALLRTCASLQSPSSTNNFSIPPAATPYPYRSYQNSPHPDPYHPLRPLGRDPSREIQLTPHENAPLQLLPTPPPLLLK
ncbi:MAG: tetratricopeptide repeat protein [Chthoniobacter sp.]|nr:tetratricopeptide repeat protein [Chthoniobacter sp.]